MVLFALFLVTPAVAQAPVFSDEGTLSSDTGHVLVQWQSDEPVSLSIESKADPAGEKTLYAGKAQAYFLSGLANGEYTLRLKGESGLSATPLSLTVAHQSLSQALWFTLIGVIITLAIIVTILKGARDD